MPVRKLLLWTIFGFLLLMPGRLFAQQARTASMESQVLKAQDDLVKAEISGDEDALNRIFTDGFTHTHSTGWVQEKEGFVKSLLHGQSIYKALDFSDVVVRFANNTTALVTGRVAITTKRASNEDTFMEVFVLENGAWRCAAWVTTPLPKKSDASPRK
jgi:hypothetical protein